MTEISFALVLNLHQPAGNLDHLLAYQPWEARQILWALDRIPRSLWPHADLARVHLALSGTLLETLAVVAYRQPLPRADVEAVRGVGCGELLTHLMEKGLIRIVGRQESLGRPVLYGTTRKFLQVYGFRSLRDLPRADEFGRPRPAPAAPDDAAGADETAADR